MRFQISGQEDHSTDPYQLSIIVKDTKDFTTDVFVKSIAAAVADFAPVKEEAAERGENWEQWLNGRFRKIVKRLKPNLFEKLSAKLEADKVEHYIVSGVIDLIVIAPQRKSFNPSYLKRAQVSGLYTIDSPLASDSDSPIIVFINSGAGMSVSKMAVSAAHALQMTKEFIHNSSDFEHFDWSNIRADFVWKELGEDDSSYCVKVVDAGLTEVAPGTLTAAVVIRD